jgi:hypothetical protein
VVEGAEVTTRLARTSLGWIAVEFIEFNAVGTVVKIIAFDEDGLGGHPRTWTSRHGSARGRESFEDFLVHEADLPREEARALAAKVAGPWLAELRDGGTDSSRIDRFTVLFYGGIIAILALAFLGFALIVWRVTDWLQ